MLRAGRRRSGRSQPPRVARLRPPKGSVHGRPGRPSGRVGPRREQDDPSGRGREHLFRPPSKALPCAAGAGAPPPGRRGPRGDHCHAHRRDRSGSGTSDEAWPAPSGPLASARRPCDRYLSATRALGRPRGAGPSPAWKGGSECGPKQQGARMRAPLSVSEHPLPGYGHLPRRPPGVDNRFRCDPTTSRVRELCQTHRNRTGAGTGVALQSSPYDATSPTPTLGVLSRRFVERARDPWVSSSALRRRSR